MNLTTSRLGPGQNHQWEVARDRIRTQCGGTVQLDRRVVEVEHDSNVVNSFLTQDHEGRTGSLPGPKFPVDSADSRPDPRHEAVGPGRGFHPCGRIARVSWIF